MIRGARHRIELGVDNPAKGVNLDATPRHSDAAVVAEDDSAFN
jgi:hypothetical protein